MKTKTKLKSITITKTDWKPGLNYRSPCDCLLQRAACRVMKRGDVDVYFGEIHAGDFSRPAVLRYSKLKYEKKLEEAHTNPKLLPMTIKLR